MGKIFYAHKNEFTACTDFPPALGCESERGGERGRVLGFNSRGATSCSDSEYSKVSSFRNGVATTVAGKLGWKRLPRRERVRTIFRPAGDNDDDDKAS